MQGADAPFGRFRHQVIMLDPLAAVCGELDAAALQPLVRLPVSRYALAHTERVGCPTIHDASASHASLALTMGRCHFSRVLACSRLVAPAITPSDLDVPHR